MDCLKRLWDNFGVDYKKAKKLKEYKPFDKVTSSAKEKSIDYIKRFEDIKNTEESCYGSVGQSG